MDVELLSRMVAELIVGHDSVALPGFGTFVATEMPASFSDRGFAINPPYMKLSFMSGGDDDGLLASLYSKSNAVDIDASRAILTHFLSELKETLKDRKTLSLPGLGRLRATRDNTFFFVPDEDIDIYPDGFGLPTVSLKNIGVLYPESPVPVPETAVHPVSPAEKAEDRSVAPIGRDPRKFRWWIPVVAVVVLAAVLMAVFLILVQVSPDFIDTILYTPEELRIINA